MKISTYLCKGWRYITVPHIEDKYNVISPELYRILKFNRFGNTCGHTEPIPIEYKNEYMKLLIHRVWDLPNKISNIYNNKTFPLFVHCKPIYYVFDTIIFIIGGFISIPFGIIRYILDKILILYYRRQYRKTGGKYFKECYLLEENRTVEFDESDL